MGFSVSVMMMTFCLMQLRIDTTSFSSILLVTRATSPAPSNICLVALKKSDSDDSRAFLRSSDIYSCII